MMVPEGWGSARPTTSSCGQGFQHLWMQFRVAGTQKGNLYGHPPTGRRIEVPEVGIVHFTDGKWKDGWYFGDELGLMLQLDALHMLG